MEEISKSLKTYRAIVAYLGKDFSGFQSQPSGNGIQDVIEKTLGTFFGKRTKIKGASRTDTGVNAQGQLFTFEAERSFDKERWLRSLNAILPSTIKISHIEESDLKFHPSYCAESKIYRYRLWLGVCHSPYIAPHVWPVYNPLCLKTLEEESKKFIGKFDFTSFCNTDSSARTKVRTIYDVKIINKEPLIEFWIHGNGFLKQMIRIMMGTLVDIAAKKQSILVDEIIKSQNRLAASQTAPAIGLSLVEIFYHKNEISLEEIIKEQERGFCISLPKSKIR